MIWYTTARFLACLENEICTYSIRQCLRGLPSYDGFVFFPTFIIRRNSCVPLLFSLQGQWKQSDQRLRKNKAMRKKEKSKWTSCGTFGVRRPADKRAGVASRSVLIWQGRRHPSSSARISIDSYVIGKLIFDYHKNR